MNNKKEVFYLKEGVKTFLLILFIYVLIFMYLLLYTARIEKLDQNSYTSSGHNRSINIMEIIKK